jgi:hypothetical protein
MLGAALLPLAGIAADAAPLPAFELRYEVLRNGSPLGEATLTLKPLADGDWEFTSHTLGTHGLAALAGAEILERSRFRWRDALPELRQYEFSQDVAFKHKRRSLRRDGDAGIDSHDGKQQHRLAFEPGVMDRNCVVLALGADLARGAQGDLRYQIADRDAVEWQRYRVGAIESVQTPAGSFAAIRVERIREKPGRTTTSWIAPGLGHVPLRTLQVEADGETLEMRLMRAPGAR